MSENNGCFSLALIVGIIGTVGVFLVAAAQAVP